MENLPRNVALAWLCFMVGVLAALGLLRYFAARVYGGADDDQG
jgi:hypothetical protein